MKDMAIGCKEDDINIASTHQDSRSLIRQQHRHWSVIDESLSKIKRSNKTGKYEQIPEDKILPLFCHRSEPRCERGGSIASR